jgi:hypothetical protein
MLERLAILRDHATALHGPVRDAGFFTAALYVEAACGNIGIACRSAALEVSRLPAAIRPAAPQRGQLVRPDGAATWAGPDLGWDLLTCARATDFCAEDDRASELVQALGYFRWRHADTLCAWVTTPACALTLVRLLRDGRAVHAPGLPAPDAVIDQRVRDLARELRWLPDPAEIWLSAAGRTC